MSGAVEVVGAGVVGSDLRFLFTSSTVDVETQKKFIANAVMTVKQFAALVDTVTELRDPEEGLRDGRRHLGHQGEDLECCRRVEGSCWEDRQAD